MSYRVELPQPWATLLVTKQINCIPHLLVKPPRAACGQRVTIVATQLDGFAAQSLADRYPHFAYPQGKKGHTIWRRDLNRKAGKMKRTRSNDFGEDWTFVADPKFGWSEQEVVSFPVGPLGSGILAGWIYWEPGQKKPSAQYKAPNLREGRMKLHKCAAGPLTWVFQRINETPGKRGTLLRPTERRESC